MLITLGLVNGRPNVNFENLLVASMHATENLKKWVGIAQSPQMPKLKPISLLFSYPYKDLLISRRKLDIMLSFTDMGFEPSVYDPTIFL